MNQLIKITTGTQGAPVVSSRDLYDFLGLNKTAFARWAKKNIETNKFARKGEDWEGFDIMSNGNEVKDYALTLDFAKRLSMLARTEKGEEARRYFLECERKANAPAPVSSEQLLLQQAQMLLDHGNLIAQLRADIDSIKAGSSRSQQRPRPVTPPHLKHTPRLGRPVASDLRQAVKTRVNEYCGYHGAQQGETYNYLYKRLHDVYGINVYRLIRTSGESLLDAIERYGHLDRIYALITSELHYVEE